VVIKMLSVLSRQRGKMSWCQLAGCSQRREVTSEAVLRWWSRYRPTGRLVVC